MTESHLPPYDRADIDRPAEDPLETGIHANQIDRSASEEGLMSKNLIKPQGSAEMRLSLTLINVGPDGDRETRQKSSFNQVICENTETSVRTRRQKQRLEESPPPSAEPLNFEAVGFQDGGNPTRSWPKVAPTSSSSYEADLNLESPSACLKWVKRELMGCGSFGSVY
ncbi:hypothetical protein PCANC_18708, partial [Puccinia coronata f. sp. avenae]